MQELSRMGKHDPREIRAAFDAPFQVVAGKGGVGRTAVSCALALRSAKQGVRTLLLEVNAPDSAARALGVDPAVDTPREVLSNLWICRMTPEGSLREYALMVLKFKALYRLVFENRMVKYLLRSIPSLGEYTMLGKAWFHSTETLSRDDGSPKYERIIVDAPATGHALTFLSVARTVADIAPKGIMRSASERIANLVEGITSRIHIVTIAEEMPVNEALDLARAARMRLRMRPGVAIVNRMLTDKFSEDDRRRVSQLRSEGDADLAPYLNAATLRIDREALQNAHADRFRHEIKISTIEVREVTDVGEDEPGRMSPWLPGIVEQLDAAAGAGDA